MKTTNKTVDRTINIVDYIPVQLRTDKECTATDYYTIRKADHSLLEFAFDNNEATILRITLLLCEEYQRVSDTYCAPENLKCGDVLADTQGDKESKVFRCVIHPNAVRVVVSDSMPCEFIQSNNVIWALAEQGDLVSLSIIDPTGNTSNHCFNELEANRQ